MSSASTRHELELRGRAAPRSCSTRAEAAALDVHGRTDAAVLVPLYVDAGGALHAVLTAPPRGPAPPRRARSRSPAAARTTTRPTCATTALREADEEIGLPPDAVELIGALQPTPTIATNYAVYPFVGPHRAGPRSGRRSADEVGRVLELSLDDLRAGYDRRRLMRRGIPFRTDTYVVGDHLDLGRDGPDPRRPASSGRTAPACS